MTKKSTNDFTAYRLLGLPLTLLFLASCIGQKDNSNGTPNAAPLGCKTAECLGIEGSGTRGTPPPPPPPPPPSGLTMTTARAEHTATLLADGKVLIAGGFSSDALTSSGGKLASAELYDPSTGTFIPTGDMTTPRARHTATLLPNGNVLIAGGAIDSQLGTYLLSAEIYDPSTGTFAATGDMIASGGWSRSTLLPDGSVLIAADSNAEVYYPTRGTFALTGGYIGSGVQVDTATLLSDGTVLLLGCAGQCNAGDGTMELYDYKSDTFSATGPRLSWVVTGSSTATLLTNGSVLLVAANDSALPDDAGIYDPVSKTFTSIGNTHSIHEFSTATRLPGGTVLIAGGQLAGGNGNAAVELYMPATETFSTAANLAVGRHLHTATLLPDGTVLIAGGYSTWPFPTSSAEIYKVN